MSNFQDNPSVGNPNNKIDGENETPLKWAYEMDKTQFKYRCPCKKGYHAHGNGPQGLRGATGFGGRTVVVVTLDAGEVEREHRLVVCVGVPR